ncbi:MAG: hypothetical protein FJ026_15875 [Chloroflexi bacterium]|nr:hypothetical protein [Chloroflexota bacterium]
MAEDSTTKQFGMVDLRFTAPSLQLPDAASAAEQVLNEALEFCAQKMHFDSRQTAVNRLRQGDREACNYCFYSVARQVAEYLGAWDENVKAVYICDYDATPEDLCFAETVQSPPVHMIIRVDRKTSALNSLVAALDRALVQKYANLTAMRQIACFLDAQVVDDTDVEKRIGYGTMLSSIHNRPLQVWER